MINPMPITKEPMKICGQEPRINSKPKRIIKRGANFGFTRSNSSDATTANKKKQAIHPIIKVIAKKKDIRLKLSIE